MELIIMNTQIFWVLLTAVFMLWNGIGAIYTAGDFVAGEETTWDYLFLPLQIGLAFLMGYMLFYNAIPAYKADKEYRARTT